MIRPFTFLCAAACVGSGMFLYTEKHNAEMIDRQIAHVIHQTQAARERAGLLRADWALLNDPARIQTMADSYLQLKPMAPNQFVQLSDLPAHLPAAEAPPAEAVVADAAPDTDDKATLDAGTPAPGAAALAAPVPADDAAKPAALAAAEAPKLAPADPGLGDAPPAPKPALVAKANPPAKTPTKLAHAAPRRQPHVAHDEYAQTNPLAHNAPLPLAAPQPMTAHLVAAMARPSYAHVVSARPVAAVPRPLAPAPYVGSALAGAGSLPPPMPLAQ